MVTVSAGQRGQLRYRELRILRPGTRSRAPRRRVNLASLRVPDHTILSRRAATLDVPRPRTGSTGAGANSEPIAHALNRMLELGRPTYVRIA